MSLTNKQNQALNIVLNKFKNHEKCAVIGGYAGTGKAQPVDTVIPTPDGNKQLQELKIGDFVFDRFGKPTKVIGIFPQGKLDLYKVTLADKRYSYCGPEHLWSYYSHGKLISKTTKEMYDSGLKNKCGYKFRIPINKPIEKTEKQYDIDPYVIGCFLGDGCCKERPLTLSSNDKELVEEVARLIGAKKYRKNSEKNYSWTFVLPDEQQIYTNYFKINYQTKDYFKDFKKEIICYASKKRIPEIYKEGSIQQRLNLIQGLMDTDGSINKNDDKRFNISYSSISLGLIQDIQEVLNSLGYSSTIVEDKRIEKYSTNICYELSINIPNEEKYKLFRLSRKKNIAEQARQYKKRKNYDQISIINIEKMNEQKEMLCLYVDNSEHLYLTNNYIVTHNTTLVSAIVSELINQGLATEDEIAFATFTGRAAQVLESRGNKNVYTLHKLLYESRPKPDGTFYRKPKSYLDYKIVFVDEISMVSRTLIDLLFSHDVFVICCGDPMQLPPLSKDEDNHLLDHPDVFLDEIVRQAAESEIIQLSMKIRMGEPISYMQGKEVMVINKQSFDNCIYLWADQILTATNKKRHKINNTVRRMLGKPTDDPVDGDKMVCLRNYWDIISDKENSLINGTIGYIHNNFNSYNILPARLGSKKIETTIGNFITDELDDFGNLEMDTKMIKEEEKCVDSKTEYILMGNPKTRGIVPLEFTYGYAITGWKAQGSEWKKVLVMEENFPFDREEHKRFLYTCCTRPEQKLVLVRQ